MNYFSIKSKTVLNPILVDIPLEIYGHILKLVGDIPLLRSVCKEIQKAHEKEIIRYNLTTPITKYELINFTTNTKNRFWFFTQINQDFIDARKFCFQNGRGIIPNNSISYDVNGRYNARLPQILIFDFLFRNNLNCDFKIMYSIIKNRSSDSVKYLRSLFINTINYYDQNRDNKFMLIYLFLNLRSFGLFVLYNSLGNYITADNLLEGDLNYSKNLLKDKLIKQINLLNKCNEQHTMKLEML